MTLLAGPFVPLATPFTDDGAGISEIRLARLVRRCMENGAKGFVVGTDAGEFTALSFAERKMLMEYVVRQTQGDVPVLVNVSSLNTSASLDIAQHASRHGARGVLLMPPYYGRIETKEVEGHFRSVIRYADTMVLAIDPENRLTPQIRAELATFGRFFVAERFAPGFPVRNDWFRWGEVQVSPAYNFALDIPDAQTALLEDIHPAKAIKGLLAERDLDLGSPRSPVLGLSHEEGRVLAERLFA